MWGEICLDHISIKKERIPYEVLISKLNSWYTTIKKNMIEEAQKKKSEIPVVILLGIFVVLYSIYDQQDLHKGRS